MLGIASAVVQHLSGLGGASAATLTVTLGPFEFGPNTFWLDVHAALMFATLIFAAFLLGAIYFSRTADAQFVRRLKVSSVVTMGSLLLLIVTGIIPDVGFVNTAISTHIHNAYGVFTATVSPSGLGNFTGPLLFDMMEHASLIVPGIAAVVVFLIFHYGAQVISNQRVRRTVIGLMLLAGAWMMVIGGIGVYITKVLTYPVGG